MNDSLFIALQRLVPQHALSRAIGFLAESRATWLKNTLIRRFAEQYQVNMSEALDEDLAHYPNFNAFFTRALKPTARPIEQSPTTLVSPADGLVSQLGQISEDRIMQAKGQWFSAQELLASKEDAAHFAGGAFATVYLSPRDYHRVHMPFAGTLEKMTYIPGQLFSVNDSTARHVPRLFARNERVVCVFQTTFGPMALVLVGAMIVASIETVWAGLVAPKRRRLETRMYNRSAPTLAKGEEMGRFLLGSTAIVLCPAGTVTWRSDLGPGSRILLGQSLGELPSALG